MPVHGSETLGEMRNILFTSSYLLDPYFISQDPLDNPKWHFGASLPSRQHGPGLGRPPGCSRMPAGGAGPAWAQPMDAICRSEHWEENGSPASTAQPKQAQRCLKNKQPDTHRVWFTSLLPSLGSRSHLHHLQGRHSPCVSNKSRFFSCSLLFPTAVGATQRTAGFQGAVV